MLRYHMERIASRELLPSEGVRAILEEVYDPGNLQDQTREFVGDSHDIHEMLGNYHAIDDVLERSEVSCDGKHGTEAVAVLEERLFEGAVDWMRKHGG